MNDDGGKNEGYVMAIVALAIFCIVLFIVAIDFKYCYQYQGQRLNDAEKRIEELTKKEK